MEIRKYRAKLQCGKLRSNLSCDNEAQLSCLVTLVSIPSGTRLVS